MLFTKVKTVLPGDESGIGAREPKVTKTDFCLKTVFSRGWSDVNITHEVCTLDAKYLALAMLQVYIVVSTSPSYTMKHHVSKNRERMFLPHS